MNLLLGTGNELNGDDSVGCFVAENFSKKGWIAINAGTVPENFLGVVKREKPGHLVIVDAADLGLAPGKMRRLEPEQANSAFYSTHSIPLSEFVSLAGKAAKKITIIGIQAKNVKQFFPLSKEAKKSAERLMELIKKGKLGEIKKL